ncbi:glycosyltransferase family 4 protein [Dyella subtropica]|uniref:glycosyltransferase family 4 protein n=1 Tax=Dyella subtropica TaxID=2992127 RepID=UPI00224D2486|nr:glycosyltransferase family 4 protein [Dyella subtropica]
MRILITNNTLAGRAGSELYVRDVALALLKRGHQPIAYSSVLGEVAEELRAATVPVIDDLASLAVAPDIIHGHHHLDAMAAMLHFPDTPAVYFCHGWIPWEEMATEFPTIRRYVAVDDLCLERLQHTQGIAPERIRIIRNFVDLRRFALRAELPAKARRALVFSNYVGEGPGLTSLRQACAERGIELDVIGGTSGHPEVHPERVLGQYDIVFAKARCALESLACGTALIVCDAAGLGEMVTPSNYETLRRLNFGIRCLRNPLSVEEIGAEIDRYDAAQAREVSKRVRAEAGIDTAIDQLLNVYAEVLAEPLDLSLPKQAHLRSASRYLRQIADVIKSRIPIAMAQATAAAQAESAAACARVAQLELALTEGRREIARLGQAWSEQSQHSERVQQGLDQHRQDVEQAEVLLEEERQHSAALQQQIAHTETALFEHQQRAEQAEALLEEERQRGVTLMNVNSQLDRELIAIHQSTLWPLVNWLYRSKERLWNHPIAVLRARRTRQQDF